LGRKREGTKNIRDSAKRRRTFYWGILLAIVIPSIVVAFFSVQLVSAAAGNSAQAQVPSEFYSQYGIGLLAAGVAVAGSCLGAGIAIYGAASAGAAAIAERPETSIWVLILAGLGEGVAIYGLLIAIIILGKLPAVG
jgi:V/A-type H+-transporting ATPase subunit K